MSQLRTGFRDESFHPQVIISNISILHFDLVIDQTSCGLDT